ncbi:MAG: hypothetical protein AAGE96_04725 [Cyanobacteria bacterium P01_G01_bin.19]
MKAIKVMGTVDDKGQIALDSPLTIEKQSRVEVIVLVSEENEAEEENLIKKEILSDLSQAWQEVKNGETIPVEELWSD